MRDINYADGCSLYTDTNCGAEITASTTALTKKWQFTNSGNTELKNLQFWLILSDDHKGGIGIGTIKTDMPTIACGSDFVVSADMNIPETVADGQYSAQWSIRDENGNSIKFPNGNNATMFFKFNLNRGIAPETTTGDLYTLLVGKTFYSAWELDNVVELDAWFFNSNGMLTVSSTGSSGVSENSYRIENERVYFVPEEAGVGETFWIVKSQTAEYVLFEFSDLVGQYYGEGPRLYITQTDALANPEHVDTTVGTPGTVSEPMDPLPGTPVIQPFSVSVDENVMYIGQLVISDNGGGVVTSIRLSGAGSEIISVELDGTITAHYPLDYEVQPVFSLMAVATNSVGESNPVPVTIQINDIVETLPITEPTTPPSVGTSPELSVYSLGGPDAVVDEKYIVRFALVDIDDDVDTIFLDWGDGAGQVDSGTPLVVGIKSYDHVYNTIGTYTWSAYARDAQGNVSNVISQSVTVHSN